MGWIVNPVKEVVNLGDQAIEDTPDSGSALQTTCILGLAKVKGGVKTLLGIDRVVSDGTLAAIANTPCAVKVKPTTDPA